MIEQDNLLRHANPPKATPYFQRLEQNQTNDRQITERGDNKQSNSSNLASTVSDLALCVKALYEQVAPTALSVPSNRLGGEGIDQGSVGAGLASPIRMASLSLAAGLFVYDTRNIPPQPVRFFQNRVEILDQMWDDTSPHWMNSSPLLLHGKLNGISATVSIAVKYWLDVYTHQVRRPWRSSGQTWRNHEVCLSIP